MNHQSYRFLEDLEIGVLDFMMQLPLPESVMDVFQLNGGRADLAVNFLEDLLAGRLSHELPADFQTTKWSFEQSVELQNRTRLYGGHWFWFGFPLLQIADGENQLLAPLWLWPLTLKHPVEAEKGWSLESATTIAPQPNPRLERFFREKAGWKENGFWWEPYQGRKLDMSGLSELAGELIDKLEMESSSQSISIGPWSSSRLFTVGSQERKLIWAGLIGIFPPSYPTLSSSGEVKSTSAAFAPLRHSFGLLARDPWQETAFQVAEQNKGALIQGFSGSGKSALLQDILINALSNGKRCLVLSDRMEVLRKLQQDLIDEGFEKMVVLFHQIEEEADLVLQLLKGAAQDKKKTTFAANKFDQQLRSLLEQKDILDRSYRAANKKILGPYTWTQVVGKYLAASRQESKALLASQLNVQDFAFGFERYQALSEKLAHSQALFDQIKTLNHPLTILNAGIFVHQEKEEARSFIFTKIEEFTEAGTALQQRFMLEQNDYGDRLVERYDAFYREILDRILNFQEKIGSYRGRFGRDALESKRTTLKLYARFSEKFRKTLAAKENLAEDYLELESILKKQSFFQHDFLPLSERHLLRNLSKNLEKLLHQLKHWREQMGTAVQEELIRLNSRTVHTELPEHEVIGELENQLDLLVERLNDSGLLQLPMENKNLTLPKRQRFLEEVMEKLERLRFNMRDFDRFYEWQRYWFGLPAKARRIIAALVKVKPHNWSAAFSSWYLHHQLLQTADPHLPESKKYDLDRFVENLRQWRKQLVDQIFDLWTDHRTEILQKLKKDKRHLYDYLSAKKEQGRSVELNAFREVLSQFFPITMASSFSDYSFLAPEEPYDYLLVDEARHIDVDLLTIWSSRARKVVLFQNPAFGHPELAAWARRQVWPQLSLEANYQAFTAEIAVEEISGRYNARQRINEEEAKAILRLLNTIEEKPQRTLPKVGIVCFTRAQRNLMIQYLSQIKRQRLPGVEKIQQLERNGLGVYVPDELYGLQLDLLLLSCTFGRTGAGDQLTLAIQSLDEQLPGMVELLSTRFRQRAALIHSIPEQDLQRMAGDPSDDNTSELARWILRIRDDDKRSKPATEHKTQVHPLAAEIGWYIADQVRTDRLAYAVSFKQAKLPLTVVPVKEKAGLAILLNDFLSETSATSYEWEYEQGRALEKAGYQIHPVWSAGWWKRPEEEAAQLSEIVNKIFEEEE